MKTLAQIIGIVSLIIITSCSSTKTAKTATKAETNTSQSIDNTGRDGSSFEKAIIVKSISDEYAFVKKACVNCTLLGQALAYNDKKPFDILRLKNAEGETVSYYFDISLFFGKGF
ncbi:hypothetical protein HNV08_03160 [Winogradskyella eckloniae]|uniref:hypothetical protein n=1 Tax=Winogradskyella eckloniae TaxID=1089306 RepID=UPI001563EA60|nr:hypothetical protein [Winogradskyella eckloniae]NRD19034.1 hypothetical protein [Winogradskyella eckloniae]